MTVPPLEPNRVIVTDVDLTFGRRVEIVLLWMFAAIPAALVAAMIVGLVIFLVRITFAR